MIDFARSGLQSTSSLRRGGRRRCGWPARASSRYANVISEQTGIGQAAVGMLLLPAG